MLTVGHSNRSLAEFLELLKAHGAELVADARTIPRSRHNPQFNRDTLPQALEAEGIQYEPMPGLGGLRHSSKASVNTGWKNLSFRGYADYMQTPEFAENLALLQQFAADCRVAILCAESVPWRCHRSLIADALVVRAVPVVHILSFRRANPHHLTPFARVDGAQITYPAESLHFFND